MKGSFEDNKSSPNKRRMKRLLHLLIAGIWSFNLKANVVLAGTDDDGFFDYIHHDDDGFFDDDYHDHSSCYDDGHFRYESDHAKDCEWVADEHKCDKKHNGKHIGEYYCRYSCGYCNVWDNHDDHYYPRCSDDEDFRYNGDYWKDCAWVAKDNRCDNEHDGKHIGKNYCPLSCDCCDDWQDPCRDDEDYRYYGDSWKDCHWIYENGRCDEVRDGKHVGSSYCPYSCNYCNGWQSPPPTKKPSSYCHTSAVYVVNNCYDEEDDDHPDEIKLYFENCHPEAKDWIGIYEAHHGQLGDTFEWWGSSSMWQFTCGSKTCSHPEDYGALHFTDWQEGLKEGEYKAYLFENDGYHVKASSSVFEVGHCSSHPLPTKEPTSTCHSSVEVEQYCYKDHYPTKLKVSFDNCHPEAKDWIGIYVVHYGILGQTVEWWGNAFMWQFTCGSKTCSHPEDYGTLYFVDWWDDLDYGEYKAYLFENDGYHVKASSDIFEVGHCNTHPPTKEPTSSCHSSVEVEQHCYKDHYPTKLKVSFDNCHPEAKDWIGIYVVHYGILGQTVEWWGNSFMWQFTCGSKTCSHPEDYGTLYFEYWWNDLDDGEYKVYLFENDGYVVKASSDIFEVGHCNTHPPTKKPTSPTKKPTPKPTPKPSPKPTPKPTRMPGRMPTPKPTTKKPTPTPTKEPIPTSCTHSSVEVEQYCYNDHYPTKLKVTFDNCHPEAKDWIGIYKVKHGHLGSTKLWWGDSNLWQHTCGSTTCNYPEDYGTLYFVDWWDDLDDGEYRAYLFANDGYSVKASSETFQVGHCY